MWGLLFQFSAALCRRRHVFLIDNGLYLQTLLVLNYILVTLFCCIRHLYFRQDSLRHYSSGSHLLSPPFLFVSSLYLTVKFVLG